MEEIPGEPTPRPARRVRVGRIVLVSGLALALAAIVAVAGVRLAADRYVAKMDHIPDPFASIPASTRPSKTTAGMTLLIAGLDTESHRLRDGRYSAEEPTARSDVLMVVRISPDHRRACVVSIPRDSWVEVPGHGLAKINAAYAWGRAPLAVQTVERLTDLRIDHVAVIDWTGFRTLTDAVGGVDVTIPADVYDSSQTVSFTKGVHHFDGAEALKYVRQRYGLPRGDIDRAQRQQYFLRLLMEQLLAKQTVTDPAKLLRLVRAVSETVKVDAGFDTDDMLSLAEDTPKLHDGVQFFTVPIAGLGREGDQSVVYLQERLSKPFWQAVKTDKMAEYLAKYDADSLVQTPR
jgi:LCP family protein required for cell wall assembly